MSDRLDDVARTLADPNPVDRRSMLGRALVALGLGAGATLAGQRSAGAAPDGPKGPGTFCPSGLDVCTVDGVEVCRDLTSHDSHCGSCGNACGADSVCRDGTCVKLPCTCGPECPSGTTLCGGSCVDLASDSLHCGTCGNACGDGQTCVSGVCQSSQVECPEGQVACDGTCRDLNTDVNNCGACGAVCEPPNATGVCSNGVCGIGTCHPGFGDCNGLAGDGCETSLMTSSVNCGACGVTCAPDQTCVSGTCT